MKDFEQLYYDEVYKNKKLKEKIKSLEEELNLYKQFNKSKNLKTTLIKIILSQRK